MCVTDCRNVEGIWKVGSINHFSTPMKTTDRPNLLHNLSTIFIFFYIYGFL